MFRKILILFLAITLFSAFSSAQTDKNVKPIDWEYLEISGTKSFNTEYYQTVLYRDYNFLTSAKKLTGQDSLEWLKDSGWELVSVVNYGEGANIGLFFKRPYSVTRTTTEIASLEKGYERETLTPQSSAKSALVDLDEQEFRRKLATYNKGEETNIQTVLEQIKSFPLKIISVHSNASKLGATRFDAEIVIDATSVLLKDGKNYRASEADKYFGDAVKQIGEKLRITPDSYISQLKSHSQEISKGYFKTAPIGAFSNKFSEINLKISAVIVSDGQQNIVAQDVIYGKRIKEEPKN